MLLFAVLMVTSCSKDDNKKDESIVGKWVYSNWTISEAKVDGVKLSSAQLAQVKSSLGDDAVSGFEFDPEFTSNGEFYINGEYDGTYRVNGNKVTITENGENFDFIYSVTNNRLQLDITSTQDSNNYVVIRLIYTREGGNSSSSILKSSSLKIEQGAAISNAVQAVKKLIKR